MRIPDPDNRFVLALIGDACGLLKFWEEGETRDVFNSFSNIEECNIRVPTIMELVPCVPKCSLQPSGPYLNTSDSSQLPGLFSSELDFHRGTGLNASIHVASDFFGKIV